MHVCACVCVCVRRMGCGEEHYSIHKKNRRIICSLKQSSEPCGVPPSNLVFRVHNSWAPQSVPQLSNLAPQLLYLAWSPTQASCPTHCALNTLRGLAFLLLVLPFFLPEWLLFILLLINTYFESYPFFKAVITALLFSNASLPWSLKPDQFWHTYKAYLLKKVGESFLSSSKLDCKILEGKIHSLYFLDSP